jgi:hypothetical protein
MGVELGLQHYGRNIDRGCLKNRALRRIFELKRAKVTGEWRKPHNEGFLICTLSQV